METKKAPSPKKLRWDGNIEKMMEFAGDKVRFITKRSKVRVVVEGNEYYANIGDWVIKKGDKLIVKRAT